MQQGNNVRCLGQAEYVGAVAAPGCQCATGNSGPMVFVGAHASDGGTADMMPLADMMPSSRHDAHWQT